MHTNSLLETGNCRHTYTHPCSPLISRTQTQITFRARLLLALPGSLPIHTQTSSYLQEIGLMRIYTHPYPRLITHILPSRLQERFPYTHAAFTRNFRTYFTRLSYCRLYCETSGRGDLFFSYFTKRNYSHLY